MDGQVVHRSAVGSAGVLVGMDGRGRALGNILVERLWRSLGYGEVYPEVHGGVAGLGAGVSAWLRSWGHDRPHQGQSCRTPAEVYHGGR